MGNVFASNNEYTSFMPDQGNVVLTDEQLEQIAIHDEMIYMSNNSSENINKRNQSEGDIVLYSNGIKIKTRAKLVIQDKNWWCGPASTEMVINALDSSNTLTQYDFARAFGNYNVQSGVNGTTIVNKLNSLLDSDDYELRYLGSETQLINDIMYSVDNGYPLIYSVELQELFYNAQYPDPAGHYIVGNAYYYNTIIDTTNESERLQYAYYLEPFNTWKNFGYAAGEKTISIPALADAIDANPNGATYYLRYAN